MKPGKLTTTLRFLSTAVVFSLSISTGCDDEKPFNPFLGTWKYIHDTLTDCDNVTDEGTFDYVCNSSDCFKISFQEGGKLVYETLTSGTLTTANGTYSFEGTELIICSSGCDDPVSFTITSTLLTLIREDDAGCTVTTVLEKVS